MRIHRHKWTSLVLKSNLNGIMHHLHHQCLQDMLIALDSTAIYVVIEIHHSIFLFNGYKIKSQGTKPLGPVSVK